MVEVDDATIIRNLAAMLRRIIWMAKKEVGDTSMKVLAGKANELLSSYGLQGSVLRDEPTIKLSEVPRGTSVGWPQEEE
jgi:hypothetical protein